MFLLTLSEHRLEELILGDGLVFVGAEEVHQDVQEGWVGDHPSRLVDSEHFSEDVFLLDSLRHSMLLNVFLDECLNLCVVKGQQLTLL